MRKSRFLATVAVAVALPSLVAFAAKPTHKSTKAAPHASPAPAPATSCKAPVKATCAPDQVSFQAATSTPLQQGYVRGITAADVNNDGKADLIAMHEGLVEVLLSAGDGTFAQGTRIEVKSTGYPVLATDIDGDCNADVVVNAISSDGSQNNLLDVLPGKGNGTFKSPVTYRINGEHLIDLFADDFNGDHKLDFAFRGNGSGGQAGMVLAARGKLGGALALEGFDFSLPWATGDLTGDGSAEIVYMKKDWGNPQLCVLMNSGKGQFADPACTKTDGGEPDAVGVADVTGDHKADVVLFFASNKMVVYVNDGKGTFDDRMSAPLPSGRAFVLVDANNDGAVDVVTYETGSTATIHVLKNNGKGQFAKAERYAAGSQSSNAQEPMAVGDFLGNGLVGFAVIDRLNNAVSVVAADCR